MKMPWIALSLLLAFTLYTGWTMAIADQSLLAFGLEMLARPDTAQMVIDLYLMAGLACLWMVKDARSYGRSLVSVLPYLVIAVVFVSAGPLLYIVVRGFADKRNA